MPYSTLTQHSPTHPTLTYSTPSDPNPLSTMYPPPPRYPQVPQRIPTYCKLPHLTMGKPSYFIPPQPTPIYPTLTQATPSSPNLAQPTRTYPNGPHPTAIHCHVCQGTPTSPKVPQHTAKQSVSTLAQPTLVHDAQTYKVLYAAQYNLVLMLVGMAIPQEKVGRPLCY